jgi:hypothetical protein
VAAANIGSMADKPATREEARRAREGHKARLAAMRPEELGVGQLVQVLNRAEGTRVRVSVGMSMPAPIELEGALSIIEIEHRSGGALLRYALMSEDASAGRFFIDTKAVTAATRTYSGGTPTVTVGMRFELAAAVLAITVLEEVRADA